MSASVAPLPFMPPVLGAPAAEAPVLGVGGENLAFEQALAALLGAAPAAQQAKTAAPNEAGGDDVEDAALGDQPTSWGQATLRVGRGGTGEPPVVCPVPGEPPPVICPPIVQPGPAQPSTFTGGASAPVPASPAVAESPATPASERWAPVTTASKAVSADPAAATVRPDLPSTPPPIETATLTGGTKAPEPAVEQPPKPEVTTAVLVQASSRPAKAPHLAPELVVSAMAAEQDDADPAAETAPPAPPLVSHPQERPRSRAADKTQRSSAEPAPGAAPAATADFALEGTLTDAAIKPLRADKAPADLATPAEPTAAAPGGDAEPAPAPTATAGAANTAAPAAASETAPVRVTSETAAALAAEVSRRLEGRETRFQVALTPDGLGEVQVSIAIGADGALSAAFSFDRPHAAAELGARASDLRQALQQAGFDIGQGALSFDTRSDGGFAQHQDRERAPQTPSSAYAARLDALAAEDLAPAHILARSGSAARGLDLRV